MRAVVTGGAGFIGSHVVDALLARGDEVHVVDNFSTGPPREPRPRRRSCTSTTSASRLGPLFDRIRPEVVVHLAAQADVGTSVERPDLRRRGERARHAARARGGARHGAQVVFSSTGGAIYGECDEPGAEDDRAAAVSPYGTSKLAAEEYLATWNRLHGTRHVVLRFANVYGPRQLPKLEGGVVSIFLDRLRGGEGITIYGDGEQTRDFVYVGDVVAAVLAAIGTAGGVFNIGTGTETSRERAFRGLPADRRRRGASGARAGEAGRRASERP